MHSPALAIDFSSRSTLAFAPVQSGLLGALRAAASQLRRMAYLPKRVNPAFSEGCPLFFSLCPLFDARVVCFQWFADSFCKTPGVGGIPVAFRTFRPADLRACFAGPLFSWSYELLFPQVFCFDNYLSCPGGVGPRIPKYNCAALKRRS
jgi:hypothetical protein